MTSQNGVPSPEKEIVDGLVVDLRVLRDEANGEKECFVRYSFQVFGISVVWLGILMRFQISSEVIGLSGILMSWLCASVARLGIYKYASANRNLGFELFVGRLLMHDNREFIKRASAVSWEVQMKAWRIVQATVFDSIYEIAGRKSMWNFFFPRKEIFNPKYQVLLSKYKESQSEKKNVPSEKVGDTLQYRTKVSQDDFRRSKPRYSGLWFLPETLVHRDANYYSGSYLRTMIRLLNTFIVAGAIAALLSIIQLTVIFIQEDYSSSFERFFSWRAMGLVLAIGFFIMGTTSLWIRMKFVFNRQIMLESELLSIHSCAITWHIVTTSHFLSLISLDCDKDYRVKRLDGYLWNLSKYAVDAANCSESIHEWLSRNMNLIVSHERSSFVTTERGA